MVRQYELFPSKIYNKFKLEFEELDKHLEMLTQHFKEIAKPHEGHFVYK